MEDKTRIKNSWTFRGCAVGILIYYSQRIREMVLNDEIFERVENNLYVFADEAINILFHLTRVFVCFREADKYFPRRNGETFKSFTATQKFSQQELKGIEKGVIYIADNAAKLLTAVKVPRKHLAGEVQHN